ncbi:uncharacterized protein LOC126750434 [Anthonomus grandis grandis]|uniref:uncharacterized protein LOC126750434 n=1 Tax=Anthonomus grandis grandis TaxID=2921223 RepID=UPI0021663441|nr:uncharacterized protein LOC126750434 [Anthonomus grandis grandis]
MTKGKCHIPKALLHISNVLWHLDIFRENFESLENHACLVESCLFCLLKALFKELQVSPAKVLPPDTLRKILSDFFKDDAKLNIRTTEDAAECFEDILQQIHYHVAYKNIDDKCMVPNCIPHQKFAMKLVEQAVCSRCGITNKHLEYTQMIQYVSTSALVYQLRSNIERADPFGRLIQRASNMGEAGKCLDPCGYPTYTNRVLRNYPEIVSIGLVWNSEKPPLDHVLEVITSIDTTLHLNHIFNNVTDFRWNEKVSHKLVGLVTYYGKHYSTFFYHKKLAEWIYLDNENVRTVGTEWEQVVEQCKRAKFQPVLLFYAIPNEMCISKILGTNQQQLLRRSITPSPEKPNMDPARRAITPNPDNHLMYQDYVKQAQLKYNLNNPVKQQVSVRRTLSTGSSSGVESSAYVSDHSNNLKRRDSGNWSGDRNSASSASSTTMENPYFYLVGKMPQGSPTKVCNGNFPYDGGYDSYSLSSNDSTNLINNNQYAMKANHQLAQIPEDYTNMASNSQSCDVLCDQADELLVKSRQLEDTHDLVLALALCNAAATKARAAMDAPYNNPQTLTLARMKHNTCIMRARSLHRRMALGPNSQEGRRSREGRHSRQNSRDKGNHSRQQSLEEKEKPKPVKNIEIYATLPKKKNELKAAISAMANSDDTKDESLYDMIKRKSRGAVQTKEKRSRSEDRNKIIRTDFSIAPSQVEPTKKEEKKTQKDTKDDETKGKKGHKIRRKLLMGGLIRRKNRSMPDLTDANQEAKSAPVEDDCLKKSPVEPKTNDNGYLSEGHLEPSDSYQNPNLERSKLMRKSFYGSAGKILTAAKVPPPPPLRTTSKLSHSSSNASEKSDKVDEYYKTSNFSRDHSPEKQSPMSLPYYGNSNSSFDDDSFSNPSSRTVVTQADVHQAPADNGVDEVDCFVAPSSVPLMDLPPYPSPAGSVIHSRQNSADLPPPPSQVELLTLDQSKILPSRLAYPSKPYPNHYIGTASTVRTNGENSLLKELEAKQSDLRSRGKGADVVDSPRSNDQQEYTIQDTSIVKHLALRFENKEELEACFRQKIYKKPPEPPKPPVKPPPAENIVEPPKPLAVETKSIQERIAEEIREVEMITSAVNKVFSDEKTRIAARPQKKKSVSFCDQVTLVSTAEEQEEEEHIPNPILERVLRSAESNPPEKQPAVIPQWNQQYYPQTVEPALTRTYSAENVLAQDYQHQTYTAQQDYSRNPPQVAQQDYYFPQQYQHYPDQSAPAIARMNITNHNRPPQDIYYAQQERAMYPAYAQQPRTYPNSHQPQPVPIQNHQQVYANTQSMNYHRAPGYRNSPNPMAYPARNDYPPMVQYPPGRQMGVSPLLRKEEELYPDMSGYRQHQALQQRHSLPNGVQECSLPPPQPVVTPIVVNNSNNKTKCKLCQKKSVASLNVYCQDCEFYMSKFRPS